MMRARTSTRSRWTWLPSRCAAPTTPGSRSADGFGPMTCSGTSFPASASENSRPDTVPNASVLAALRRNRCRSDVFPEGWRIVVPRPRCWRLTNPARGRVLTAYARRSRIPGEFQNMTVVENQARHPRRHAALSQLSLVLGLGLVLAGCGQVDAAPQG